MLLPKRVPIAVAAALALLAGTVVGHSETYFTQAIPPAPGLIFVDCAIEGSAKKLMLDTGASLIALKKEYEREKSDVMGRGTSHSGETFTVQTGIGPTIEIQSFKIPAPTCMFVDLPSQLGPQVVGILGMDPRIAQAKLYFDNKKSSLTAHSGDWLIDGKSDEVTLIESENTPVFQAQICGHDTPLLVDTGSTVSFTLPKEVFDKLVEEKAIKKAEKGLTSQTVSGTTQLELGIFLEGEFMGRKLRGVEVLVGRDRGTIGLPWLRNFDFEIWFEKRLMRFQPVNAG